MNAKHLRGITWGLAVNIWDQDIRNRLSDIPGLRLNAQAGRAEGTIDAIGAACLALGRAPPPKPEAPKDKHDALDILRPYQQVGVTALASILRRCGGAVLADDMGLGKTLQAITTARVLAPALRKFVVAPAAVRETWRDDLAKWNAGTCAILGPIKNKKDQEEWDHSLSAEWVITSYEMADRAYAAAFTAAGESPAVLIVDEAHLVKGRKAKRASTVEAVAATCTYRIVMSGTPMDNRPRDLWRILRIALGKTFGNQYDFDRRYCGGNINDHGGWVNKGTTNAEELRLRLGYYMVRREKKDVLQDLPPLTRQIMWVDGNKQAEAAFHKAMVMRDGKTNVQDALEATLLGKMQTVYDLAAELKRFVVFTWKREHARQMSDVLGRDYATPCIAITGDMDTKRRQDAIKQAIAQGCGVVATIDSVGTGVDALKHVASTAIVHAIDWMPLKMAQAEARLHRLGQLSNVHVVYLAMKDSMDAVVVRTVVEKLDSFIKVVGGDDAARGMRNELDAYENGAGSEQDALRLIYESMEDA